MKQAHFSGTVAAREHLISGNPITRLEALTLFGLSNLTNLVSDMRKQGWVIKSKRVLFAAVVRRVNEYAVYQPPKDLPIREIKLTEYWLSK